ncbi:hypothetical protein GF326_00045 [Candidatus Bathyarchaeota archaeon]|nr:hypothetical protein [Candidatus Bathyarchaeota archaeon]
MIYILTSILSITLLSLTMRKATLNTDSLWGVIQANYITAATIMTIFTLKTPNANIAPFTIILGAITGLSYTAGMYLNLTLMGKKGAAITSSMIQLAVIIPITASIFIYNETITRNQFLGITLAVISLPLLAAKPMKKLEVDKKLLPKIITTILVVGFSQLSSKILIQTGYGNQSNYFFQAIFTSAALLVTPLTWKNRAKIKKKDTVFGIGIGIFNILSNMSLLLALTTLPGAIVFTVSSAGSLFLVTISALILFNEKTSKTNLIGIILTLIAVILVNV